MKKYFEKHDLFKITGIMVLITILLTWIVPTGSFTGTEVATDQITRVGLIDFMQNSLLSINTFTVLIVFLISIGIFYDTLSKTNGYSKLIDKISQKIENHKIIFLFSTSLFFSILSSISTDYIQLLVLIPFFIAIMNKSKINKICAFCSTFASIIVGILGSTYNSKVVEVINNSFGTTFSSNIIAKIILLIVAFALLNFFIVKRFKNEKESSNYDKFELSKNYKSSTKIWPYVTCGIILMATTILAYLPWSSWEITTFDSITEWFNGLSIFGEPIIKYVFGEFSAFGTWNIFTIQFVLIFTGIVVAFFNKFTFDEYLDSWIDGFNKICPVIITMLSIYVVLEFSMYYKVLPVIVDNIANIFKGGSTVSAFINAILASTFGVEMEYVMDLAGTYYATLFADNAKVLSMVFQTAYGLIQFIIPTSAILMTGLSYMNIKYKDWMKFIWKYVVSILVVIIAILLIITFI